MFYWIILGTVHTKDMGNVINVFQQALHLGFFFKCILLSVTPVRRRLIAVPVNQSEMVKLAKHAHSRIFPEARSELKDRKTTAQCYG